MKGMTVLMIAGLALILVACSSPGASADAMEITVEVSEFKFQPSVIEVAAGQRIKLQLRNTGAVEHDFSVMEIPLSYVSAQASGGHDMGHMTTKNPQLHIAALNGKTSLLEFTPTQAGNYEILCMVAGHKEAGMVAKLIVKAS